MYTNLYIYVYIYIHIHTHTHSHVCSCIQQPTTRPKIPERWVVSHMRTRHITHRNMSSHKCLISMSHVTQTFGKKGDEQRGHGSCVQQQNSRHELPARIKWRRWVDGCEKHTLSSSVLDFVCIDKILKCPIRHKTVLWINLQGARFLILHYS